MYKQQSINEIYTYLSTHENITNYIYYISLSMVNFFNDENYSTCQLLFDLYTKYEKHSEYVKSIIQSVNTLKISSNHKDSGNYQFITNRKKGRFPGTRTS